MTDIIVPASSAARVCCFILVSANGPATWSSNRSGDDARVSDVLRPEFVAEIAQSMNVRSDGTTHIIVVRCFDRSVRVRFASSARAAR